VDEELGGIVETVTVIILILSILVGNFTAITLEVSVSRQNLLELFA
jgi:NADH:ubiquinone oxidoreductase subunit 2 (subunit N)